jgi:hypothetical protein
MRTSFELRSPAPIERYVPKVVKHEQSLQLRVCRYLKRNYPQVPFIADFAAGMKMTRNQRMIMMSMRSDDGQPDISVDYSSRGYHRLRIELKKGGSLDLHRYDSFDGETPSSCLAFFGQFLKSCLCYQKNIVFVAQVHKFR